jgi:hypothetical protein
LCDEVQGDTNEIHLQLKVTKKDVRFGAAPCISVQKAKIPISSQLHLRKGNALYHSRITAAFY